MFRTCSRLLVFLFAIAAAFAVPQQINYQGYLARPNGTPLDTTVSMTFRLWNAEGSIIFWTETHPSVTVNGGIFDVELGQYVPITDPTLHSSSVRLLGITVGNDAEMSPRVPLASVPYARRVGSLSGATGGVIYGNIIGGWNNTIMGDTAFVFGVSNNVSGSHSVVSGGRFNTASGTTSTVGGGRYNRARGICSVVAGGGGYVESDSNSALGDYSSVGGGHVNSAAGTASVVAGGTANTASGSGAGVFSGGFNSAEGTSAVVGGGSSNVATGWNATVPGGGGNTASGDHSLAAGHAVNVSGHNSFGLGTNITCAAESAFVWSDGTSPTLSIGSSKTFSVKATAGTRIWTSSDLTAGVRLNAGGSAWISVSDSTKKRSIRGLDTEDILNRFSSLPLKRWEYQSEEPGVEHIGPMAQDFWDAFHLGNEPLGISTIDADGVMMATVQQLCKEIVQLRAEMQALKAEKQTTANRE